MSNIIELPNTKMRKELEKVEVSMKAIIENTDLDIQCSINLISKKSGEEMTFCHFSNCSDGMLIEFIKQNLKERNLL